MADISYTDFDLLIERLGENAYRVRVLFSPAGQAVCDTTMPFSPLELENFLLKIGRTRRGVRRLESPEMEAAKTFGSKLFKSIFQENVLSILRSSQEEAQKQNQGLRLRLRLNDAPELLNLPWEFLYNPSLNRFLSLSVSTPVVRYLELPERIRPLAIEPPLKMLVMISSPSDYPGLDVEREWANLTTALGDLVQRGLLVMDRLEAATSIELQTRLRRNQYHIFHFIGHGGYNEQSQDGVLLFETESGRGWSLSGQFLGTLLHDETSLRLAVLNACEGGRTGLSDPFSGVAQSLVQQGLPAVIAMQFEVTDQAAITFAREFYTAIADNYPVDAALAEARKAIFSLGNDVEWATPVLYMRAQDGVIFDVSKISQLAQQPSVPEPVVSKPPAPPVAQPAPSLQASAPIPTPVEPVVSAGAAVGVRTPAVPEASAPPTAKPGDRRLLFALGGLGAVVMVILLILLWGRIFSPTPTPVPVVEVSLTPTSEVALTPTRDSAGVGAVTQIITPTATASVTPTAMLQSQTNGKWIAYASRVQLNSDLSIYNLETGERRSLTSQHLGDISPVFSPDGRQMAFNRCKGNTCTLYLMEDLDNPSSVRSLETPGLEARNPDWCPDPEQLLLVFEGRAESRREIWMINVKSGELTQITRGGGDNQPDWSPDCNQVAFGRFDVTDPFQIEDLYVVNLGNQKDKRIETRLTSTKDVSEANVSWSPDGDWLAFARKTDTNGDGRITGDDRNELWTLSPSGSTEPQRRRTSDKFSVLSPSWSPDSDQILFAAYYAKDSFELWIYSMVTDQAMKIPGLEMGTYYYPQWSP